MRWHGVQAKSAGCDSERTGYDLDYDSAAFDDLPNPCDSNSIDAGDDYSEDGEAVEVEDDDAALDDETEVVSEDIAHGQSTSALEDTAEMVGASSSSAESSADKAAAASATGDPAASQSAAMKEAGLSDGGEDKGEEAGSGEAVQEGLVEQKQAGRPLEESLVPLGTVVVHEPATPLSKRMRVSIRSARGDVEDTVGSSSVDSIHMLIALLDSVGALQVLHYCQSTSPPPHPVQPVLHDMQFR